MYDLIFSVPWWLPALLAILGIVIFLNGNKVQVAQVRNAGAGLVIFALGWALVSYLVDTDKEKVERGMAQMIQAVVDGAAKGDYKNFTAKLAPNARFVMGSNSVTGADKVTSVAREGAETVKLKSAQIRNQTIEQTGSQITVHCDIFSTQESYAPIETSNWQFEWEKTPDGWRVREMRLLKLKELSANELDGSFPGKLVRP